MWRLLSMWLKCQRVVQKSPGLFMHWSLGKLKCITTANPFLKIRSEFVKKTYFSWNTNFQKESQLYGFLEVPLTSSIELFFFLKKSKSLWFGTTQMAFSLNSLIHNHNRLIKLSRSLFPTHLLSHFSLKSIYLFSSTLLRYISHIPLFK